jgi:hypothetical protein
LFALTHQFLQQRIEGDELYTRVKKHVAPDESQGWTVVLMDRATRFLWDMHCGRKDRKMFKKAMGLLCYVIQQTGDLTLLNARGSHNTFPCISGLSESQCLST